MSNPNPPPSDPGRGQAARQFLYVLKLVPRLHDRPAWTDADRAIVDRHVAFLEEAARRGQVILAGRTDEPLDRTFGLTIFEAVDAAAAQAFMTADPAIAEGVMTANLHPYRIAVRSA